MQVVVISRTNCKWCNDATAVVAFLLILSDEVMLFATWIYVLSCRESVDMQQWLVRFTGMFSWTKIYLCEKNFSGISAVVAELRFSCFCLFNLHFNSCIYDILYLLFSTAICFHIFSRNFTVITFLVLWIGLEGKGSFSLFLQTMCSEILQHLKSQ